MSKEQKEELQWPRRSWLPDPDQAAFRSEQQDIAAANAGLEEALAALQEEESKSRTKCRKRGMYQVYDSKTMLTIAWIAEECGLANWNCCKQRVPLWFSVFVIAMQVCSAKASVWWKL